MDYALLLSRVTQAVNRAGELLIAEWQRPNGVRGAGDKADVDLEIEALLRPWLLDMLDCDFWGEETGYSLTGSQFCWVVDPNDGTADFLKGHKGSAISVGLLEDSQPVLGVVYAPVLEGHPADCIAWARDLPSLLRNGEPVDANLSKQEFGPDSRVMVSTAARLEPELNSELCAPGIFVPMPSIAYRLACVAAGDGGAGVSLVPVSAHDVVAGHALLKGAGGVLLNQDGEEVSYVAEAEMDRVSDRCFGGSPAICRALVYRSWDRLFE